MKKYLPEFYKFISDRFSFKTFAALPFTILIVALIVNLLLILDFVEDLINSKSFATADARVLKFFTDIRTEPLAKVFYVFTQAGDTISITILCLAAVLFLLWKKKYHYILALIVTVSGSAVSIYSGKNTFHILRPSQNAYYLLKTFSFPSGHATYAVSTYGLLIYMLVRNTSQSAKKIILISAGLLFILLIGLSRLYLGVHFLSDVVGGFMLGMLWLLSGICILEWKNHSIKKSTLITP